MAAIPLQIPVRRRHPRYELTSPVEVTVLRSGIPQNLPGRLVDAGVGGISAVLSGDLYIGESVGVEFSLFDTRQTVQARARVRYQDRIRCGLEFSTLSASKLELVRLWTEQGHGVMVSAADTARIPPVAAPQFLETARPRAAKPQRRGMGWTTGALLFIAFAGIVAFGAWAYRHFPEVTRLVSPPATPVAPAPEALPLRVTVASSVMQSLITYRTVPVYPALAQQNNIEGTVLLDTIVGKDGRVVDLQPVSGPPELAPAATQAVKSWRFSPFTLNGDAVEVETTIEVEFRLQDR
jgi:TonB family protein